MDVFDANLRQLYKLEQLLGLNNQSTQETPSLGNRVFELIKAVDSLEPKNRSWLAKVHAIH